MITTTIFGSFNYKNAVIAVPVINIAYLLLGSDTTIVFNWDALIEID